MASKFEITHRCEAPWRHIGTRKIEAHTYPFAFNGKYLRLCSACWKKEDEGRRIKRGTKA